MQPGQDEVPLWVSASLTTALHYQLNETYKIGGMNEAKPPCESLPEMAKRLRVSPHKLIGYLGTVDASQLDEQTRQAVDGLYEAFQRYCYLLRGHGNQQASPPAWKETCRQLGAALKALRLAMKGKARTHAPYLALPMRTAGLTGAFFHACKVDGRNLP